MRRCDPSRTCCHACGIPRLCAALAALLVLTSCSAIEDALGNAPAANTTPEIIVTYVSRPASGAPTAIALATMTPAAAPVAETSAPLLPTAPPVASACPAPANPTPPARPALFSDIPAALTPYLSAGATPTATRDLLTMWGVIFGAPDGSVTLGGVYQGRFVPGGDLGTVVVIFDPAAQTPGLRAGDVLVHTCADGAVQLAYRAQDDPLFAGSVGYPRVLATSDVNGDGVDELSFVTGECGASTCFDIVTILSFRAGSASHLIPDFTPHPFPAFAFAPAPDSAAQDLIVQVGQYGSPGAGPQRNTVETWSWNGSVYTLTRAVVDPPVYRVHALHDADAAFRAGDFATAGALYQRVVSDPALKAWDGPAPLRDEDKVLGAFALYRLLELAARQQDGAALAAAYDALKQATPQGSPGELYGALGDTFYAAYTAGGSYGQACDAAVKFAEKTPNIYILLGSQTFGYANYDYQPADMCAR